MTFIAHEIRLCWQAVSELRACAADRASEEERRLRRGEVESIALLTDRPEIKRRCEDALRSTGLHALRAEAGSSLVPLGRVPD